MSRTKSTAPPPSIAAARRSIVDHITADAIDNYETAKRRNEAYEAAFDEDIAFDEFLMHNAQRMNEAKDHLVRVLLERSPYRPEGVGFVDRGTVVHPTCGVIAGGRLYLASVEEDDSEYPAGTVRESRAMHLVVADMANVVGVDLTNFDDLDAPKAGYTMPAPSSA